MNRIVPILSAVKFYRDRFFVFVLFAVSFVRCTVAVCAPDNDPPESDPAPVAIGRYENILRCNPRKGAAWDYVVRYHTENKTLRQYYRRSLDETAAHPDDAKSWMLRALLAEHSGDADEAIGAYREAERKNPVDPLAPFYLGRLYLRSSRYDDAVVSLEKARELSEKRQEGENATQTIALTSAERYDLMLALVEAYCHEKDRGTVRRLLANLDVWFSGDIDAQLRFLREAARAEIAEALSAHYESMLRRNGFDDDVRSRILLARCDALILAGEEDRAAATLRDSLETAPRDAPLRLKLVEILFRNKRYGEIDAQYEILERLFPDRPEYALRRGAAVLENPALDKTSRKQKVRALWTRLLRADRNDTAILVTIADSFASAAMPEEAERSYRLALEHAAADSPYRAYLEQAVAPQGLLRLYAHEGVEAESVAAFSRRFYERNRESFLEEKTLETVFGTETSPDPAGVRRLQATVDLFRNDESIASGDLDILEKRLENTRASVPYLLEILRDELEHARRDRAESVARTLERSCFPDADSMLRFSSLLTRLGEDGNALRWKRNALLAEPETFFADPAVFMEDYETHGAFASLVDDVTALNAAAIEHRARELALVIERLLRDREHRGAGLRLLEHLWNRDDFSRRDDFRHAILKGLIWNTDRALEPYYREWIFDTISPEAVPSRTVADNPHRALAWSSDACRSFSLVLLASTDESSFPQLETSVRRIVAEHEALPVSRRQWASYSYAVILDAMIDVKSGRAEEALLRLKRLEKNEHATAYLAEAAAVLGREFAVLQEIRYRSFAIACFEKALNVHRDGYGEIYLNLQLLRLGAVR